MTDGLRPQDHDELSAPAEGRRELSVPGEDWRDVLRTLIEGAAGTVPVVGSLGAAVFQLLLPSAYQKRTQAWQREVADDGCHAAEHRDILADSHMIVISEKRNRSAAGHRDLSLLASFERGVDSAECVRP